MKFSILIPVYRAEKYLAETIQSCLEQTEDLSCEILLAEDGSPDASGEICDRFASEYPERIRVLHLPHQGTVKTRRAAIREARGDYLIWVDSDDTLLPGALVKLAACVNEHPAVDIVIYEMNFRQEIDGRTEARPPLSQQPRLLDAKEKNSLYELLIAGSRLDSLCIKMIKASLMQEDPSDYSLCENNPYGEDVLHCLYPLTRAASVLLIPDVLYQYRIHEESVMHIWDEAKAEQRLNPAKWSFFEPFLEEWGMADISHRDRLKASSYKAVLDGLLHLWQHGGDRQKLKAFANDFARNHPEMKELAASPHIARRLRFQLKAFAHGRLSFLVLSLRLYKLLK